MPFILGVLVIGALLSAIFGRRAGQMFVMGTASIAILGLGVLLVLLSPLIYGFFSPAPIVPSAPNRYVNTAPASTGPTYSAPNSVSPTTTYSPPSTYSSAAPVSVPPSSPTTSVGSATPPTGMWYETLLPGEGAKNSLPPGCGVLVGHLTPGSPADRAGIRLGDYLSQVDGNWITSTDDIAQAKARHAAGDRIKFRVVRGGKQYDVFLSLTN